MSNKTIEERVAILETKLNSMMSILYVILAATAGKEGLLFFLDFSRMYLPIA